MDRLIELTKYISKEDKGIEIGPWFNPVVPKYSGYNSCTMDVFSTEELIERTADPIFLVPQDKIKNIEKVDFISTSTKIESVLEKEGLLGSFDYIVSSHNFEHLPNPILFLQGCGKALKKGGILSMAIPDKRACYDHYRPYSTLSNFIEAYKENRERPTYTQVFDAETEYAWYMQNGIKQQGCGLDEDPANFSLHCDLSDCYEEMNRKYLSQDNSYYDVHCWTLTPSVFELIVGDLNFLDLSPFEIIEIGEPHGHEFFVHLRNTGKCQENRIDNFKRRSILKDKIINEMAYNSSYAFNLRKENLRLNLQEKEKEKEIKNHIDAIKMMHASSSWKVTSPLRWLKKHIS